LRRQGGEIFYVIDFSVLYSYMWKSPSRVHLRLADEADEHVYARRQVALSFLFGGAIPNLLLIPPYSAELRNHLEGLKFQTHVAEFDLRSRLAKISRLVQRSPEFKNFLRASHDGRESHELATSRAAAIKLGKAYFPELYTILRGEGADVLTTLRNLFDKE